MEELKQYLSEQGLTDFIDELDVLNAKCRSMEQHIQLLEQKVNDIRLDVAKRAVQGLMANPKYADTKAEDIADIAIKQTDVLLMSLQGLKTNNPERYRR